MICSYRILKMTRFNLNKTYLIKRTFQTKNYRKPDFARNYSENFSSNAIRQKFLDYFIKENDHKFVRSSPVMPFCDPTVAFVNAGMNQFKSIFLGQQEPLHSKVANSQKCVRVGGKHNDISIVGSDGYHHTFFEMLGNWSFDNYFKKEACEMAWNLLTGPYGLNPSSLYATYFAGDSKLNLGPDLECKDIWRSIGIADDHILPFGPTENFWEMGQTGPCGPCTEIHIDHTGRGNRAQDVNKGLSDLTELWNIVFIQYDRKIDGSINLLPKHHIDTGLGLERLTAILQGKSSNYDTDLFSNLLESIHKKCKGVPEYRDTFGVEDKKGIDTSYRILADHSRMITACLADGMIPEENQKLRRILRKAMLISETVFRQEKGLLTDLVKVVAQDLGHVYPEMEKNLSQVQQIIEYEEEVYKSIRSTATKEWLKILDKNPKLKDLNVLEMPGLVTAYNELTSTNIKTISPQLAFKLYDTYGLDEQTMKSLSNALDFKFESEDLKKELEEAKRRTKQGCLSNDKLESVAQNLAKCDVKKTDDSFKYSYRLKNSLYKFDDLDVRVLGIVTNGNIVNEIESNIECYLILNRTNLYSEAGGQTSDTGIIKFSNNKSFKISDTILVNGYVFHKGQLTSNTPLQNGESGVLSINIEQRLKNMANHSATHLLNAALKTVVNGVTCQKSSKVTPDWLSFDVGIYSKKLSSEEIEKVENIIRNAIRHSLDVKVKEINSQELLNLNNVTIIPGEIYPDVGIRLVEVESKELFSREPCCGTHVLNTADIQDFCIISSRSLGRSTTSLIAVTKDRAIFAHKNGQDVLDEVLALQNNITDAANSELNILDESISQIKQKLNYGVEDDFIMPVHVKSKCAKILSDLSKQLKDVERDSLRQFIDLEMKSVVESNCSKSKNNKPYIVHFLGCSSILDNVPLQRATKICQNIPVIVISYSDDTVKARCCVPESMVTPDFNAELWMKNTVGRIFKSSSSAPKGQDATLVCNMKAKKINKLDWETILDSAISEARTYADTHL